MCPRPDLSQLDDRELLNRLKQAAADGSNTLDDLDMEMMSRLQNSRASQEDDLPDDFESHPFAGPHKPQR